MVSVIGVEWHIKPYYTYHTFTILADRADKSNEVCVFKL